jgi:hypothetical protein
MVIVRLQQCEVVGCASCLYLISYFYDWEIALHLQGKHFDHFARRHYGLHYFAEHKFAFKK